MRNGLWLVASVVLAAALVLGGYLWSLATAFDGGRNTIVGALPLDKPPRPAAAEKSLNILLMGSEAGNSGSAEAAPDMMMLLHLPGDRSGVYALSILPGTSVDVPGYGTRRLDSAMSLGGVPLTVASVQNMFNTPIDHVAVIDFEGFRGLTSALGGVTVNNGTAFSSGGANGDYFPSGPITLEGDAALNYVRTGQGFTDGDIQQVKNQQAFVAGIVDGMLTRGPLNNAVTARGAISDFAPFLSVDAGLDSRTLGSMAVSLRSMRSQDVHMFALRTSNGAGADGGPVQIADPGQLAGISGALASDTVADYVQAAGSGAD
ncbi:LCP family protein [Arthrobacter sp. zg-Y40]|uniref:LCP family protein n=1 Tax=Arthrobacter sp. zg-Y40 TaxID=2886939 RepID=UPI001D155D8E|nr:LCP family protein [Arthrobacter sp. zg-Y40]